MAVLHRGGVVATGFKADVSIQWSGPVITQRMERGLRRGIRMATEDLREEILRSIYRNGRSGRIYRKHGGFHQASAPGEPPAHWFGNLVRNIRTVYDFPTLRGRVVSNAVYSEALEFGSPKMLPRPFLRPAQRRMKANTEEVIAREVRIELAKTR